MRTFKEDRQQGKIHTFIYIQDSWKTVVKLFPCEIHLFVITGKDLCKLNNRENVKIFFYLFPLMPTLKALLLLYFPNLRGFLITGAGCYRSWRLVGPWWTRMLLSHDKYKCLFGINSVFFWSLQSQNEREGADKHCRSWRLQVTRVSWKPWDGKETPLLQPMSYM